jgi:hypothetical protein
MRKHVFLGVRGHGVGLCGVIWLGHWDWQFEGQGVHRLGMLKSIWKEERQEKMTSARNARNDRVAKKIHLIYYRNMCVQNRAKMCVLGWDVITQKLRARCVKKMFGKFSGRFGGQDVYTTKSWRVLSFHAVSVLPNPTFCLFYLYLHIGRQRCGRRWGIGVGWGLTPRVRVRV